MSHDLETLRTMKKHGWSRAFATEYVMGIRVLGLNHAGAIREAKRSPVIRQSDIPRGV